MTPAGSSATRASGQASSQDWHPDSGGGRKGLYAVREQESGLQFLERYPVPPLGSR